MQNDECCWRRISPIGQMGDGEMVKLRMADRNAGSPFGCYVYTFGIDYVRLNPAGKKGLCEIEADMRRSGNEVSQ